MIKFRLWISIIACEIVVLTGLKIHPDEPELTITSRSDLVIICEHDKPVVWVYPTYEPNEGGSKVEIKQTLDQGVYKSKLTLRNAFYLDTGYYACEPENNPWMNERVSIYIYVYDETKLLAVNESVAILSQNEFGDVVIPCRPTSPDVNVTLTNEVGEQMTNLNYDPKIGYVMKNPKVTDSCTVMCEARRGDVTDMHDFFVTVYPVNDDINKPYINASDYHLVEGSSVVLNCTITEPSGIVLFIKWILPDESLTKSNRIILGPHTALPAVFQSGTPLQTHYRVLTISNVSRHDEGNYVCKVTDHNNNQANTTHVLTTYERDATFLNMELQGGIHELIIRAGAVPSVQWVVNITAYPRPEVQWFDPSGRDIASLKSQKYSTMFDGRLTKLVIYNVSLWDSGIYSVHASIADHKKSLNLTLLVEDGPQVELINDVPYYTLGEMYAIECGVNGYPLPRVEWWSKTCNFYPDCEENHFKPLPKTSYDEITKNHYQLQSIFRFHAIRSSILMCNATNEYGQANASSVFLVSDVKDGFAVRGPDVIAEGDNVTLNCGVSAYSYQNDIRWFYRYNDSFEILIRNNTDVQVSYKRTNFSYQSDLILRNVDRTKNGEYVCQSGVQGSLEKRQSSWNVDVKDVMSPSIVPNNTTRNGTKYSIATGKQVKFNCHVQGIPPPIVSWWKDGRPLKLPDDSRIALLKDDQTKSHVVKETLLIKFTALGDDGHYVCLARNRVGNVSVFHTLALSDKPEEHEHILYFAVIAGAVFIVVICCIWVYRYRATSEKLKKDLAETGLLNFEEGAVSSLNPELGVEDQADLLPYDKRWEFPREKLKLGKQLGSGAFGVVMKAEADGIIDENTTTTVAVKMVKRGADSLYIKALASELKIMIHLGRHLNVVNLLGACTKDIRKRELIVIVEYCRYGNLHDFLLKQRSNFIDQINEETGKIDTSISVLNKNIHYDEPPPLVSNGTVMTTLEETPIGTDGYLMNKDAEPDWRSNYRGDYRNTIVKPIKTIDLICWSFQIARGMEYLASRKVLHGDLAARNILLADDNIVKICDFGLAKSMYNSENYQRRKHELLPVRWMAIESIRDRIFSTQSDVWSFGVTLWELFSLSVTPYPGIEHLEVLYTKLVNGHRMEQPAFATKEVYEVMLDCWHSRPTQRPTFSELADKLGTMLEDGVRSHYTKLNEMYLRMNAAMNSVDYLSLLNPPVYTNSFETQPRYVNVPLRKDAEHDDDVELRPMLGDRDNNYVNVGKPVCFMNPTYTDMSRLKSPPPPSYTSEPLTPTLV